MKYAVIKVKRIDGVRHLSLEVIFETELVAQGYCDMMNENCSSVRIQYYVQSVSDCNNVIQHDLIMRCMNIANCLHLAEVCFFKNSLENASHWLSVAKERSKIAADLLEIL